MIWTNTAARRTPKPAHKSARKAAKDSKGSGARPKGRKPVLRKLSGRADAPETVSLTPAGQATVAALRAEATAAAPDSFSRAEIQDFTADAAGRAEQVAQTARLIYEKESNTFFEMMQPGDRASFDALAFLAEALARDLRIAAERATTGGELPCLAFRPAR